MLVAATLAAYHRIHNYDFVNIDDNWYVYGNPHVLGPLNFSTVVWAFTHAYGYNYDPLTFFSHSLDVRMFGLDAGWHHTVNLAFHVLNALLVFWVFKRATGFTGRSFMVAALFALHPINVENLGWISERKTLLSTVFFLLALGAYRWYACEPKRRRMLVVAALYVLGLLAKPQVITLPFVLLLWDYWPLRRVHIGGQDSGSSEAIPSRGLLAVVREKIPLFVIAAGDALVTLVAQHVAAVQNQSPYTLPVRIENAVVAYAQYLGKAVWPTNLAFEYLYRGNSIRWWEFLGSSALLLLITAAVLAARQQRYLLVGWLWFLGTLVPMIGLVVQSDLEALADRYAYTSFIGLFVMVCWGAAELAERLSVPKFVLPATSVAVLAVLALITHQQTAYWRNSFTMWNRTLDVTHRNWVADTNLGGLLWQQGRLDEALTHYYRAAQERPRDSDINLPIALIEYKRGNPRQAVVYYQKILDVSKDPKINAQVLANMGRAYGALGDYEQAEECYRAAQRQRAAPPPTAAINWHGEWWRDIAKLVRERWDEWRSGPTTSH